MSWTARVETLPASEPAPGSVRAKAARPPSFRTSHHIRFWSSVPANRTGAVANALAAIEVATPAQPFPSSSYIMATVTLSRPNPPYSSGTITFSSPMSAAILNSSGRVAFSASISPAMGVISFSTNSRTTSCSSSCSSVNAKFIVILLNTVSIFTKEKRLKRILQSILVVFYHKSTYKTTIL